MAKLRNPIGFTPWPVTALTVAVYVALFSVLLRVHHVVPPVPSTPTPARWPGVNLTESWMDLQTITKEHHPWDSEANGRLRKWLIQRVEHILDRNKVTWHTTKSLDIDASGDDQVSHRVTIFDEDNVNALFAQDLRPQQIYFQSNNIVVYIRGTQDEPGAWWHRNGSKYPSVGGVLINAHFDSVQTSYGATDNGMGVASVLQVISHLTAAGHHQPRKGVLALFNNAEELFLLGASAFVQTPLASFAHTFVNVEGAGSGGRATLFRSTDMQVVRHYAHSDHPFGTVLSQDAFGLGLIRSGTDFSVLATQMGMRGLDIAFMAPRSRYHTPEDDTRDISINSLWHMLSASLSTVRSLSDDHSSEFDGSGHARGLKIDAGSGDHGVWFDVFGRALMVMKLHDLFALSVTLLVVGPLLLLALDLILRKMDKWYPLARSASPPDEYGNHDQVKLFGMRGFFRFPLVLLLASAAVILLALLMTKINPYIIYSSPYAVWATLLTAWICTAWFFLRLSDAVRPTALSRFYGLVWLYAITWVTLVVTTAFMDQKNIAGGYFLVIYHATVFGSTVIAYLDFFALPRRSSYAAQVTDEPQQDTPATETEHNPPHASEDAADERTSLLGSQRTFVRGGRDRRQSSGGDGNESPADNDEQATRSLIHHTAYQGEQEWSARLPGWTWLLQFLLLGPVNVTLVGQLALLITSAISQTCADGNSVLPMYMTMASLSVLLLIPMAPFAHRLKWQLPTLLLFLCVGTALYCLVVFPFSRDAKLRIRFTQEVDLDTGVNTVILSGVDGYVRQVADSMPSTKEKKVFCDTSESTSAYGSLPLTCRWEGLMPEVARVESVEKAQREDLPVADWVQVNVSRNAVDPSVINLRFRGLKSRVCTASFDSPPRNISINNGEKHVTFKDEDWKYEDVRERNKVVSLYSRDREAVFDLSVSGFDKSTDKRVSGSVMCAWNDVNELGVVPAYDELLRYIPVWASPSAWSSQRPLLGASKRFSI